jgi:3-isopropylmalate/(R)-2-methylmalate dehydratase small subunit
MVMPADLKWADVPSLPPGAKITVIEGPMNEAVPFTIRLKFPKDYTIPAHSHPAIERVTVLSGTFHMGTGDKLDKAKGHALRPARSASCSRAPITTPGPPTRRSFSSTAPARGASPTSIRTMIRARSNALDPRPSTGHVSGRIEDRAMDKFTKLEGVAAPLRMVNIDTDMIIPKNYLKTIKRTGLGKGLFAEKRFKDDGSENPDFVLNKPAYRNAKIIVADDNFGCGSSREHAPWALLDFGIRCVISTSFGDIFYNNCFKNGILPIKVSPEDLEKLFDDAERGANATLSIDLEAQEIRGPDGGVVKFEIDQFRKHCLLNGLDDVGLTMVKKTRSPPTRTRPAPRARGRERPPARYEAAGFAASCVRVRGGRIVSAAAKRRRKGERRRQPHHQTDAHPERPANDRPRRSCAPRPAAWSVRRRTFRALPRSASRACADSGCVAACRSSVLLCTPSATAPKIAIASRLASEATALLMPEATPACRSGTALITDVVSGATVIAMPRAEHDHRREQREIRMRDARQREQHESDARDRGTDDQRQPRAEAVEQAAGPARQNDHDRGKRQERRAGERRREAVHLDEQERQEEHRAAEARIKQQGQRVHEPPKARDRNSASGIIGTRLRDSFPHEPAPATRHRRQSIRPRNGSPHQPRPGAAIRP